tara:strand:- start:27 stop:962 length:936 start_codon:yes stop_codon:yes gene_type:complete
MSDGADKFKLGRRKSRRFANSFLERIRSYAGKHKMPEAHIQKIKNYLGLGQLTENLWASDLKLRGKFAEFLGEEIESLRDMSPELNFQFWTLLPTNGNTSDREPIIDLKTIRSAVDRTFRTNGLNGIYVIEVQGLGNHPNGGKGRTLMTHVHAITWKDVFIDLAPLQRKVAAMSCWKPEFGASAVDIQPVSEGEGEAYYLAHYLLKVPAEVKMLENRANGPRLKGTEKGLRPEFAARLLELLSQVELDELIGSVGTGREIRTAALRRLRFWHRSRRYWSKGQLPTYLHEEFWSVYRKKKKRVVYLPYCITR